MKTAVNSLTNETDYIFVLEHFQDENLKRKTNGTGEMRQTKTVLTSRFVSPLVSFAKLTTFIATSCPVSG